MTGRVVVMDGDVSNNQHYNMSMTSPTAGSLSVSVPDGDTQILLVVVAVPEYFKGHQTYGYQVNIKSTSTTTLPPATTTTMSTVSTTSSTLQIFEASLTVVNASSVYDDNYEKYGPEQALTPVSLDQNNYWHSAADDDNPSITFKMQHEHEVLAVEVVDRQDCCNERFQNVEVRVGNTLSFDDAQSCGIQSYEGEKRYK